MGATILRCSKLGAPELAAALQQAPRLVATQAPSSELRSLLPRRSLLQHCSKLRAPELLHSGASELFHSELHLQRSSTPSSELRVEGYIDELRSLLLLQRSFCCNGACYNKFQAPESFRACCRAAASSELLSFSKACLLGFSLLAKKKAFFFFWGSRKEKGLLLCFFCSRRKKRRTLNPKTLNLLPHSQFFFILLFLKC